jgi:hypothetical protein
MSAGSLNQTAFNSPATWIKEAGVAFEQQSVKSGKHRGASAWVKADIATQSRCLLNAKADIAPSRLSPGVFKGFARWSPFRADPQVADVALLVPANCDS